MDLLIAIVCPSQYPKAGLNKKSAGIVLVACPAVGGLRIAYYSRTSNTEAHACM